MGKSSKDKRDLYYRKAKEEGWRARSAFKLLQLDSQFHLLNPMQAAESEEDSTAENTAAAQRQPLTRVVDLCAAPGSWSQVLSKRMYEEYHAALDAYTQTAEGPSKVPSQEAPAKPTIVAVDLQPMAPIAGVTALQADITHPRTISTILSHFGGAPADLVISDGAPDVTGLHDLDEYIQAQLIHSALQLATALLKPVPQGCTDARAGGAFVAKIFRGRDIDLLYEQMGRLFVHVACAKPRSSRASSLEAFIVGLGYRPCPGWDPRAQLGYSAKDAAAMSTQAFNESVLGSVPALRPGDALPLEDGEDGYGARSVAPFIACGDLSAYDADATYALAAGVAHVSLDPVQAPTAPPYKRALEMKRAGLMTKTK